MYEQDLYKIIDPIKKTTISRLNKGKNGNMDTIKNGYTEFYLILLQSNMNIKETKKNIIQAGQKAVEELIKVAKEPIVDSDDDI